MELRGADLVCERGGRRVFAGLTFHAASGDLLLLRGPNGAGKTSLLRMIAGLLDPVQGRISLTGAEADLALAQQCHFVAHQEAIKPSLTVIENLRFWARFLGEGDVRRGLEAFGLQPLADIPAALLSAGQKRRLALSRLGMVERPVWLLDEPTNALDSISQVRLARVMGDHLEQGGLIVAATHVDLVTKPSRIVDFDRAGRGA